MNDDKDDNDNNHINLKMLIQGAQRIPSYTIIYSLNVITLTSIVNYVSL